MIEARVRSGQAIAIRTVSSKDKLQLAQAADRSSIRSGCEEQEAFLLFKSEAVNNLPEVLDSLMLWSKAIVVQSALSFQGLEIQRRITADQQLQFFRQEQLK